MTFERLRALQAISVEPVAGLHQRDRGESNFPPSVRQRSSAFAGNDVKTGVRLLGESTWEPLCRPAIAYTGKSGWQFPSLGGTLTKCALYEVST
jgi:hypothetical protein